MYKLSITHTFFPRNRCIICGSIKKAQINIAIINETKNEKKKILEGSFCIAHIFNLILNDIIKINQDNFTLHEICNIATEEAISERIIKNSIKNLKNIKSYKTIKNLKGICKPLKCIIIGCGPSIDKQVEQIKKIEKKVIIIAPLQAIDILKKNNIEADYIFSVDSSDRNKKHCEGIEKINCGIITDISATDIIFEKRKEDIYLVEMISEDINPCQKMTKEIMRDIEKLKTGYSVTTTMISFAKYCGFNTIYFAGVDCGYKEEKTHCKEYRLEKEITAGKDPDCEYKTILGEIGKTSLGLLAQAQYIQNMIEDDSIKYITFSNLFPAGNKMEYKNIEEEVEKILKEEPDKTEVMIEIKTIPEKITIDEKKKEKLFEEKIKIAKELLEYLEKYEKNINEEIIKSKEFKTSIKKVEEVEKEIINVIENRIKQNKILEILDNYLTEINKYMEISILAEEENPKTSINNIKRGLIYISVVKEKLKNLIKDLEKN